MTEIITQILRFTGNVWDTEADFIAEDGNQEHIPAGVCCPGSGDSIRVSVGRSHIRRPLTAVRVAWELRLVGGGSERNTGSPLGDDMGIGRYIRGS